MALGDSLLVSAANINIDFLINTSSNSTTTSNNFNNNNNNEEENENVSVQALKSPEIKLIDGHEQRNHNNNNNVFVGIKDEDEAAAAAAAIEVDRQSELGSPKGRVPWNLAGLVAGHLQAPSPASSGVAPPAGGGATEPLLTAHHNAPSHPHHYPPPHHHPYGNPYHHQAPQIAGTNHYHHLLPPPPGAAGGVAPPPHPNPHQDPVWMQTMATSMAAPSIGQGVAINNQLQQEIPDFAKLDSSHSGGGAGGSHPIHPAMYYQQQNSVSPSVSTPSVSDVLTHSAVTSASALVTSVDPLTNFSAASMASMESQDVMNQVLNQYFEEGTSWLDPNHPQAAAALHHHHQNPLGAEYPPEYLLHHARPYTDRKKKIIEKWTKSTGGSGAGGGGSGSTGSTGSPVDRSVYGSSATPPTSSAELFSSAGPPPSSAYPTSYVKDEPYYSSYANSRYPAEAAAAAALVHPYHHHITAAAAVHHASAAAAAAAAAAAVTTTTTSSGTTPTGRKRKKKNAQANNSNSSNNANGSNNVSSNAHQIPPHHQGLSRDERKALSMNLPIPVHEIINLPMDEFNDLLSKHDLSEEQLTLCRDIRRRGKNKVAARNCRKRKIDQIKQLEDDVNRIRCRKSELIAEHEKLQGQRRHWSDIVKRLHDYVLKELGHDPSLWELQMDNNRQVHILPKPQTEEIDPSKIPRPYHYAPSVGPPVMEHTHIPNN